MTGRWSRDETEHRATEHPMDSISSLTSSASAMVAKQTANLNRAVSDAKTSFASTLSKVQSAVTPRPKTGFKSGATYEAGTLSGQTKAAFSSALTAIQSAVTIKPDTGIK
jgi:hypothetical protein